jgi:hypothetical protein
MKRFVALLLIVAPVMAAAQLLPGSPLGQTLPPLPNVGGVVRGVVDDVAEAPRAVTQLATDRLARIDALVRDHPAEIARDDHGDPARAGDVLVTDADEALVTAAAKAGFVLIERNNIPGVDIGFARFQAPSGKSLPAAIRAMRKLAGKRAVSADQLHFQSGAAESVHIAYAARAPSPFAPSVSKGRSSSPIEQDRASTSSARTGLGVGSVSSTKLGMIDGSPSISGTIIKAGFASGAGSPSNHGSAVASLMLGAGRVRGAAPGARLWAADVYGTDAAGGNALAIARAIGWLTVARVPVTVISLVGPANPLLARVVQAAQAKGMIIVAAVGNDGAASPPSYPASYPGVIAVTGTDARDRVLIEAGRALHLDYAAPGADMLASDAGGSAVAVRGTSFAAPLVAARIALAYADPAPLRITPVLRQIDAEARRMGPRYGRGIVCAYCRTPTR